MWEEGADEAKGLGSAMGGGGIPDWRAHARPARAFHDRHARDAIRHRNFATSHGPKVYKLHRRGYFPYLPSLSSKKLYGSLSIEETILSPHFTFDSHFNSASPDGFAASTLTQNATLRGVCCHGYLQFAAGLPVTRIQLLRAPTITVNFCIAGEST